MAPLAIFGTFGFQELLVILLIVVFLFGARKIPEVAKGLGEGIRGFRASLKGDTPESESTPQDNEAQNHTDR
jgi:sec-independent protein translocase protein TatA